MARNLFRNGPLCPEGQTDRESKRQETNIVQQAFIVADTRCEDILGVFLGV
jgi:hypothetical protein